MTPIRRPDRAPITMAFIESKCEEEGECLLWTGALNKGSPSFRVKNKTVSVRRYIAKHFLKLRIKNVLVLPKCKVKRCVAPGCIKCATWGTLNKQTATSVQANQRLSFREKQSMIGRAKSPLTAEAVAMIRASTLSNRELARQCGCAISTVHAARTYKKWKDFTRNPFAGLMK